jgi:uncharacterized membrane protein (DUF373 family)
MATTNATDGQNKLARIIRAFERAVVVALVVMMMLVVALATLELCWIIAKDIYTPPILLLEVDELLEIFGFFLLILIGVELLETIKAYLKDNVIHVEIVLEVALIALARKVIVLDLSKYDGLRVLSVAALIIALAGAFFLERRSRLRAPPTASSIPQNPGAPLTARTREPNR